MKNWVSISSEQLAVQPGCLLLHAQERVTHEDSRVLAVGVEIRRQEEIGRDHGFEPDVGVGHGLDADTLVVRISDDYRLVQPRGTWRQRRRQDHS